MFQRSACAILTKMDLLPHVPFDVERATGFARQVNPDLDILTASALSGEGLDAWYGYLIRLLPATTPA